MTLTVGGLVFVDTNIFLTSTDRGRNGHRNARAVLDKAARSGLHLVSNDLLGAP
jgi:predicted nucleic acid-binding protein